MSIFRRRKSALAPGEVACRLVPATDMAWHDAPPPEEIDFGTVGEFLAACREVRPDLTGKRIRWRTNGFYNYTHELLVLREAIKPEGESRAWVVRVIESQGANISGGWDRVPGEFQKGAEGAMDERYLLYRMEHKGGSYPNGDSLTYAKFMERIAREERIQSAA